MAICINQSGTWRNISTVCINQSGTWRNSSQVCINDSATWRRVKAPLAWVGGPTLGTSYGGGYVICGAAHVGWIVAPSSSQVARVWGSRADAVTRAQQVSGCTGWFVPTFAQLQNPGYTCKSYWDTYNNSCYWSDTESTVNPHFNANTAFRVDFAYGGTGYSPKGWGLYVRAFRCVAY